MKIDSNVPFGIAALGSWIINAILRFKKNIYIIYYNILVSSCLIALVFDLFFFGALLWDLPICLLRLVCRWRTGKKRRKSWKKTVGRGFLSCNRNASSLWTFSLKHHVINIGGVTLSRTDLPLNPVKPDANALGVVGPINDPIITSKIAPTIRTSSTFWTLNNRSFWKLYYKPLLQP